MSKTFSVPGLIEVTSSDAPVLENWTNDSQVNIKGSTFSVNSYNFGTARATVKVAQGRWYYEVKIITSGSARIGWATEDYKPESRYDGVGSDADSWGWDGSRKQAYHDEKKHSGTEFGDYWSNGDIIGVSLDFDLREMHYYRNNKDMGVAFKNVRTSNPLMPCFSLYRGTQIEVNLGPTFKHPRLGFYGVNPTLSSSQYKSLAAVFNTYHKKGLSGALNESLSKDLIKVQGVSCLGEDLGAKGAMDPHLLLLAWKMRSKKFFEFIDNEWFVLWANEKATTFDDIRKAVLKWIQDIKSNEDNFTSFYGFCFDYLKLEKGARATVLDKEDALMAWEMLGMRNRFVFYDKWTTFWKENDMKGVTRDVWMMLLKFIKDVGNNAANYNMDDAWPTVYDDFVCDYLKA